MKFEFIDRKAELPASAYGYAEKKVGKLDRYFKGEAEAFITFRVEKQQRYRVEVTVRSNGTSYRAEKTTTDVKASIDAAVTTIEGQIRKNKTRLAKRLRNDAFERTVDAADVPAEEPEEEAEFTVVRAKKFPLKPMGVEEAILQMNLLGHNFFAFRNEDDNGTFAVVYARQDGGYGLIEEQE
jgi:putative sigma-54 modulation protein